MLPEVNYIFLLIASGITAGILAGLFGVGGGLVIVPALFFILQNMGVAPEVAIAMAVNTSLVSIIPTALSSARAHHKLNNVDWMIVYRWAPPMIVGVLLGAAMVAKVRTPWLIMFFGCLLLLVALNKLLRPRSFSGSTQMPKYPWQALVASLIGWASATAGVGGGATGVPALTAMGVSIHRAVGTCAALGLCIALPGSLLMFTLSATPPGALVGTFHLVYLPALFFLAPATVLCAPMGAWLGKKLSPRLLSLSFALLLIVVGGKMVSTAF